VMPCALSPEPSEAITTKRMQIYFLNISVMLF
jgi:hypothetical protein